MDTYGLGLSNLIMLRNCETFFMFPLNHFYRPHDLKNMYFLTFCGIAQHRSSFVDQNIFCWKTSRYSQLFNALSLMYLSLKLAEIHSFESRYNYKLFLYPLLAKLKTHFLIRFFTILKTVPYGFQFGHRRGYEQIWIEQPMEYSNIKNLYCTSRSSKTTTHPCFDDLLFWRLKLEKRTFEAATSWRLNFKD